MLVLVLDTPIATLYSFLRFPYQQRMGVGTQTTNFEFIDYFDRFMRLSPSYQLFASRRFRYFLDAEKDATFHVVNDSINLAYQTICAI